MDGFLTEPGTYVFGPYRLDCVRRVLLRDGAVIDLRVRVFEILLYLVQNAGQLVERDEILDRIWRGRIVEDSNITQAIYELRKVLRTDGAPDNFIVTLPSRGYRFAAIVRLEAGSGANLPDATSSPATRSIGAMAPPSDRRWQNHAHWSMALSAAAGRGRVGRICHFVARATRPR